MKKSLSAGTAVPPSASFSEPLPPLSGKTVPVDRFLDLQQQAIAGDECSCRSLSGVYLLSSKAPDGAPPQRLLVRNISSSDFSRFRGDLPAEVRTVAFFTSMDNPSLSGIIVETTSGWEILWASGDRGDSSSALARELLARYLDALSGHAPLPAGLFRERVAFDDAMVEAGNDRITLRYASRESLRQILSDDAGLLSHAAPWRFFDQRDLRVPPEMAALIESTEFQEAKQREEFSHMTDLLFAKAMEVTGGNIDQALLVSLITTDLRGRGPCGAVFGKRGYQLVPRSLFDREQPTIIDASRRDASMHFFAFALAYRLYGAKLPMAYEWLRKEINFFGPRSRNFLVRLHGDTPKFGGEDGRWFGPLSTDPYYSKLRREVDDERDLYVDRLGLSFGKRLDVDPLAKPSDILNAPAEKENRRRVGLAPDLEKPWKAADPHDEETKVFVKPPEERGPQPLPSIGYASVAVSEDCQTLWAGPCEEKWDFFSRRWEEFIAVKLEKFKYEPRHGEPSEEYIRAVPVFHPKEVYSIYDFCRQDEKIILSLSLLCENTSSVDYRLLACELATLCLNDFARSLRDDFEAQFGPFPVRR